AADSDDDRRDGARRGSAPHRERRRRGEPLPHGAGDRDRDLDRDVVHTLRRSGDVSAARRGPLEAGDGRSAAGAGRTRGHALVAEFDHQVLRGETPYPYVVQTEQHKLSEIGLRRLSTMSNAEVRLGTSVTGVEQEAGSVRVTAAGSGGEERHAFDYVIGCDGG